MQSGAIECIGSVEDTTPPKIVVPLTVEPNKPRLCVNLMYLNNWIRDKPFSLDTLKDVPRVAKEKAYFSSIDDKSGFDNVRLAPDSYDLVVFQYAGYFFRCLTLPFGFKLCSYIYHTLNLQPTSYIRSKFSVPVFLYIDDRLVEELRQNKLLSDFDCARVANSITCEILTRLGYCLNLVKSVFVPTQTPTFLGFVVDSVSRCFRLTEAKKEKFARFRYYCLTKSHLSVLELQQLAGKCSSFILAVPGSRLFTRKMNYAISLGIRSKSKVHMYTELREQIQSWNILDTWNGKMEWKKERHIFMELHSDASLYKWGGVIHVHPEKQEIYDFWSEEEKKFPIIVLEAMALLKVLREAKGQIKGQRVDAKVDNMSLYHAFYNEGCKSRELNGVLKDLFNFLLENDVVLN